MELKSYCIGCLKKEVNNHCNCLSCKHCHIYDECYTYGECPGCKGESGCPSYKPDMIRRIQFNKYYKE